jgi:non-reducing end alpha-L-arabinofuranosidase
MIKKSVIGLPWGMQRKILTILRMATFTIWTAAAGCGGDSTDGGAGRGGQNPGSGGAGGKGGSSNGGRAGASTAGSGGSGGALNCTNVTACGGNVVGSWTVTSSCLKLSGQMDVQRLSLGCASVPVNGSLTTSGTFRANADGTYTDNTTTRGSATFPLAPSCLSVSSVPVECDRAANIFSAAGWDDATCTETNGTCNCSLSTEQAAGLGQIAPFTTPSGNYTISGTTLTIDQLSHAFCSEGNTLTLTPQASGLTGTVVLQKDGGMGGSGGAGGAPTTGGAAGAPTTGGSAGIAGMGAGGNMGGSAGAGGSAGSTAGSSGAGGSPPVGERPCDIYATGDTECVAAHSTVRALFAAYTGPLYQVRRADGMTLDIPVKSTGGFADSAQQESFCMGSTCTIWRVYDQSGRGNFLEAQTPDSTVGGRQGQTAANAAAEDLNVSGNKVYSLYTRPSQAYWRNGSESGLPLGAEPQGVYMVTSGTHFNGGCCYNYGNAQTSRTYEGGPTMDSVYFGNCTIWGRGAGEGPWVMADMEDGIVSGRDTGVNNSSPSLPFPYVTAMEKNNGTTEFAIRGANVESSELTTMYKGALPNGKNPMRKEGAIVLGSGGDCCYSNNNASEGTFYEGAIVSGYPSDATEAAVHANIVGAGYGQ